MQISDLKSWAWQRACGFDSRPWHQSNQRFSAIPLFNLQSQKTRNLPWTYRVLGKIVAETLPLIPTCQISMQMKLLLFQEIWPHSVMQFSSIERSSGQKLLGFCSEIPQAVSAEFAISKLAERLPIIKSILAAEKLLEDPFPNDWFSLDQLYRPQYPKFVLWSIMCQNLDKYTYEMLHRSY